MMNNIQITNDYSEFGVTHIELMLTKASEDVFKDKVFPLLFDGETTGSRSFDPMTGQVRYNLLVYDATLVQLFKHCLFNAILIDNGQMN